VLKKYENQETRYNLKGSINNREGDKKIY